MHRAVRLALATCTWHPSSHPAALEEIVVSEDTVEGAVCVPKVHDDFSLAEVLATCRDGDGKDQARSGMEGAPWPLSIVGGQEAFQFSQQQASNSDVGSIMARWGQRASGNLQLHWGLSGEGDYSQQKTGTRSWVHTCTLGKLKEKGWACGLRLHTRVSTASRRFEPTKGFWAWAGVHKELASRSRTLSVVFRRACGTQERGEP